MPDELVKDLGVTDADPGSDRLDRQRRIDQEMLGLGDAALLDVLQRRAALRRSQTPDTERLVEVGINRPLA